MKRLWYVCFAAAVFALLGTTAVAQSGSAAIAYCIDTRSPGVGESSRSDLNQIDNAVQAATKAIQNCVGAGGQQTCCKSWVQSTSQLPCVALSIGPGTRFGTGRGRTQKEAVRNAGSECGGFCEVAASKCTVISSAAATPPSPPVAPPRPTYDRSVWDHNGSTMVLSQAGNQVTIDYRRASDRMRRGVSLLGSRLFQGEISANTISGTAYIYNSRCRQKFAYYVTGTINSSAINLEGAAPKVSNCRQVGSVWNSNAYLKFLRLNR